jgi:hypothetical protein
VSYRKGDKMDDEAGDTRVVLANAEEFWQSLSFQMKASIGLNNDSALIPFSQIEKKINL